MKQLVLTGISQETPLASPDDQHIELVFNGGAVRVPTNEYGIQVIIEWMSKDSAQERESAEETPAPPLTNYPPGVAVFGAEGTTQTPTEWVQSRGDDDEDETYDINDGVGSV